MLRRHEFPGFRKKACSVVLQTYTAEKIHELSELRAGVSPRTHTPQMDLSGWWWFKECLDLVSYYWFIPLGKKC